MTVDDADGVTAAKASVARTGAYWPVFVAIAALVLVVDQLTKAWLAAHVAPGEAINVVGENLRLIFSQNSGALFGLFRDNAVVFGVASLAVIALIVAYHARSGRSLYFSIALGLLLGGALGNVSDRLRLGYVVDFVDMGIGAFRWYTFNAADAAISVAIVMLVAAAVFPRLTGPAEGPSHG